MGGGFKRRLVAAGGVPDNDARERLREAAVCVADDEADGIFVGLEWLSCGSESDFMSCGCPKADDATDRTSVGDTEWLPVG